MEENATGRFLKANSGQDKTRAGKMMAAVGKSQSFSAQQRWEKGVIYACYCLNHLEEMYKKAFSGANPKPIVLLLFDGIYNIHSQVKLYLDNIFTTTWLKQNCLKESNIYKLLMFGTMDISDGNVNNI